MPVVVDPKRASFRLSGPDFEPVDDPAWRYATRLDRRAFWAHVARLAYEEKIKDLRAGRGVDGRPLQRVKPESRPDGATGPALSPHRAESRFQRLLRYGATDRWANLWWGNGWSAIVRYHAFAMGPRSLPVRDVVGLTRPAQARVKAAAADYWRRHRLHLPMLNLGGNGGSPAPATAPRPNLPRPPIAPPRPAARGGIRPRPGA